MFLLPGIQPQLSAGPARSLFTTPIRLSSSVTIVRSPVTLQEYFAATCSIMCSKTVVFVAASDVDCHRNNWEK